MGSVTYFAREGDFSDWEAWATLWEIDSSSSAVDDPTEVEHAAEGEFTLDAGDLLYHDWGTGSSLAIARANDEYWAAWSDKIGEDEPSAILGSMGYAQT